MNLDEFGNSVLALEIHRNAHRMEYHTIHEHIKMLEDLGLIDDDTPDEARAKMIQTDTIWEIRWYPSTTVGFCTVYRPTFEEAWAQAQRDMEEGRS